MRVRELLEKLHRDGWRIVRITGSHRILKHSIKNGTVVVAGLPSKDVAIGTLKSVLKEAELED